MSASILSLLLGTSQEKEAKLHPVHWTAFGETPPSEQEIAAYYDRPRPKATLFKGTFKEFCAQAGLRKKAAMDPATDEGKVDDMDADDDAEASEGNRNGGIEQDKLAKCSPLETLLRKARNATHEHATEKQRHAGNYAKGRLPWQGTEIAIENPKGSIRRGKDKSGKAWSCELKQDYGYFCKVGGQPAQRGKDKDHVDVFVGEDLKSEKVFIIDQTDPDTGKFDEHKVCVCFDSEKAARDGYLSNYSKGWLGLGSITETTIPELKTWLKSGDTKKPFAEKGKKASVLEILSMPKEAGLARMAWDSLAPFPKVQKGIKELGAGMVADSLPVKLTASTLLGDPKILTEGPVETADRYLNKMNPMQLWKQEAPAPKPSNPPAAPLLAKKSSALDQLLQAKEHSDAKRYTSKHAILRKLLADAPEEFFVDSDDKAAHPGLTHKPTGFQIHAPRTVAALAKGEKEKKAVVEKDEATGKWILWTKDKSRKLGTHDKPEDAYKQEYAIQKSMEKKALAFPLFLDTFQNVNHNEKQAARPSFGRTLGVGLAGALPGRILGELLVEQLVKHRAMDSTNSLPGSLIRTGGSALGAATAQAIDGQFQDHKWDEKGKKIKPEKAKERLKAASAERIRLQALLDFHTKRASDSGFGGGSLPQIPHSTPSVESPGAWESAGGLQGIGRSAVAPIKGLADSAANTWKDWGGLDGVQNSVSRTAGSLYGPAWASELSGRAAAGGANMWANKDRTWNTLMTGTPGSTPEKKLLKPIEYASMDDTPLPGEGEGGFMDSLWKSKLMPTELVRGVTNAVGNGRIGFQNAFSGGKGGFGEYGTETPRYRRDGTPIV